MNYIQYRLIFGAGHMKSAVYRLSQVLILLGYDEDKYPLKVSHRLISGIHSYADSMGDIGLSLACELRLSQIVDKAEKRRSNSTERSPRPSSLRKRSRK